MESTARFERAHSSFADCGVDRFTTWTNLVRAVGFEPTVSELKVRCNSSFASRACLLGSVESNHVITGPKPVAVPGWLLPIDDSPARIELARMRLGNARSSTELRGDGAG